MNKYERAGIYTINDVFTMCIDANGNFINGNIIVDGKTVTANSLRYQTFYKYGTKCVQCGLEGKYFALERDILCQNKNKFHFNLYGIDLNGNEIMLTKDHIIPKFFNGKDILENMQTMCTICNNNKSNNIGKNKLIGLFKPIEEGKIDINDFKSFIDIARSLNYDEYNQIEELYNYLMQYKNLYGREQYEKMLYSNFIKRG